MNKKSKDFGAVRNEITGKTIREMSWEEILTLPVERLSPAEAMRRMKDASFESKSKK